MNADIYTHFHPDEHAFIDKAAEWVEKAAYQHQVRVTDFLDPRQLYILHSLINRYPEAALWSSGGYDNAERQRALIAPDYTYVSDLQSELKLQLLEITSSDDNFTGLKHSDFLGAMLGLGIKREKTGDIHSTNEKCHIVVAAEIADFIRLNLNQVHRVAVFSELVPLETLNVTADQWEEGFMTVTSQRLDAVLGQLLRLSRAKALQPIRAGHCKVNWKLEEDPSHIVQEGDILSVRGFGRYKLIEFAGKTKKGNLRLKFGKRV